MKILGPAAAIIASILFAFTLPSYAERSVIGEANEISKEHVLEFIRWLNSVGSFEKMSENHISAYFANEFKYYTNGELGATNPVNLHQRYVLAKKYYKLAYIHFPVRDIQIDGKKAAAKFRVTFIDRRGRNMDAINSVVIKFNKDGKVEEYSQTYNMDTSLSS